MYCAAERRNSLLHFATLFSGVIGRPPFTTVVIAASLYSAYLLCFPQRKLQCCEGYPAACSTSFFFRDEQLPPTASPQATSLCDLRLFSSATLQLSAPASRTQLTSPARPKDTMFRVETRPDPCFSCSGHTLEFLNVSLHLLPCHLRLGPDTALVTLR